MSISESVLPAPKIAIQRPGLPSLPKAETGISGLDEITGGGFPRGRATLVCGPAGCGKTLLGLEFVVRGITEFGEPGVFVAFEESAEDLAVNVGSLGFDLAQLQADGLLVVDHVNLVGAELDTSGEWDLEALFIRLGAAIDEVKATRVVLDTIENLFGVLTNAAHLRSELRRLLGWLKSRGVTAVITAERGDGALTRHGIEEYVSDCVIVLDHRVILQRSTRRLRVLKYRGSLHGTNEYPFFIGARGVSVQPITSSGLQHAVSDERIATGIPRLDGMLGGTGVYRGSSVLVSGSAGTGKSIIAASFCRAACSRGERAMYIAFEESEAQIIRNMASVGIDLDHWVRAGLLQFYCVRPQVLGPEVHLAATQAVVREFSPTLVVMDPISGLMEAGGDDAAAMLTRKIDFLKARNITMVLTGLTPDAGITSTSHELTSMIDTWLVLRSVDGNGERNRGLYIFKSRGMAHSNQLREFQISSRGIELADVYVGPQRMLMGSGRAAQQAEEHLKATERRQDLEQQKLDLERRRESVAARTAIMWREFEAEADVVARLVRQGSTAGDERAEQRVEQGRIRSADMDTTASDQGQDER
jgi:circadian clock protein KaiC